MEPGAVVGKGEIIDRNPSRIRKPLKLDSISQADSFCIDFDITQKKKKLLKEGLILPILSILLRKLLKN